MAQNRVFGVWNMINSPNDIWEHVLEILREKLTQVAINTWFNECSVLSVTDSRLVLCIPSDFKRNIVESRFKVDIMNALRELFSGEFDVSFVGLSEIKEADEKEMTRFGETEVYSFSNFVVGNSNKFAYAAAKAVADEQGRDYSNPLFIYGESGLGKTHLLYAIRNQLKKAHPEYYIVLIRGGDFVTELVMALQTGRALEFKEKYKSADVFLVDDIQVIAGKDRTEEEVFHIFNTLYEAQKQIVLTSDRPPEEMLLLPERLKSRFSSGLLADITVPDYETRMAIIMKKSNQLGLTLSNEVMDFIAKKITANIRHLEGAVKLMKAQSDLMDAEITLSIAQEVLAKMFREKESDLPTPEAIIEETAKYFNFSAQELTGKSRVSPIVNARQIAMYLIKQLTNLSGPEIGKLFNRDNSTVLYSIDQVAEKIPRSKELSITIKDITANLNSN